MWRDERSRVSENILQAINNIAAWSDAYPLGMPEFDAQHKMLFVLIDRLRKQVVNRADSAEALEVLEELERHLISHFVAEETFMGVIGYHRIAEHKAAHENFLARITCERAGVLAGGTLTIGALRMLKDWLVDHILVADRAYSDVAYSKRYKQKSASGSALGRFFKRFQFS